MLVKMRRRRTFTPKPNDGSISLQHSEAKILSVLETLAKPDYRHATLNAGPETPNSSKEQVLNDMISAYNEIAGYVKECPQVLLGNVGQTLRLHINGDPQQPNTGFRKRVEAVNQEHSLIAIFDKILMVDAQPLGERFRRALKPPSPKP